MMTRRRRFAQPEITSPESRWQDATVARSVVPAMSSAAAVPPPAGPPSIWTLPSAITGRLGAGVGPQRALCEEGHLLLALHQPQVASHAHRAPAWFWRSPDGEWRASLGKATGAAALHQFLASWEGKLAVLEQQEATAASAAAYHAVLEEAAPLLRAARGLLRALQQAREAIPADRDLISARDRAAAIERSAELIVQDARFGMDFTAARNAEMHAENSRRHAAAAHRLNLLAAFFLPVTAIAGIFGMELGTLEKSGPGPLLVIVGIGLTIGAVLALWINRRAR